MKSLGLSLHLANEVHRATFAILWMDLREEREGLSSMATTFAETAGVDGRQKFVGAVCLMSFFCFFMLLANLCDRVVYQ